MERLLQEMNFLEADLEYHQSVIDEHNQDFNSDYDNKTVQMGVVERIKQSRNKNKKGPPPPQNKRKTKSRPSKKNKDIYKKIASIAHPDKLLHLPEAERLDKEKKFIEASEAVSHNMMLTLYRIAKDLGVDTPAPTSEDIKSFEEEIDSIKNEIKSIETTWIWNYASAESPEVKEEIMKRYVEFVLTTSEK